MRRWLDRRILTLGFTILTLLVVSGCSAVAPAPSPGVNISSLKIGDCTMGFSTDTEVTKVAIVPCDQPHVDEYYASITVEGDTYPGDDAIWSQAETYCAAQFETFVGIPYEESRTLRVSHLVPTQYSWDLPNGREIRCAVVETGVRSTTGSLRGAAR